MRVVNLKLFCIALEKVKEFKKLIQIFFVIFYGQRPTTRYLNNCLPNPVTFHTIYDFLQIFWINF